MKRNNNFAFGKDSRIDKEFVRMEMDRNVENMIRDQIETLKRTNAEMRQQVEQEINKNTWFIYALEKLLEEHKK